MAKIEKPPRGFAKIPHAVCADPDLTDAEFRVLCAITRWSRQGGYCWATTATIGKRAGSKDERSARRALESLAGKGPIVIIPDPDKKTHRRIATRWTPAEGDIPRAAKSRTKTAPVAPDINDRAPGQICPPSPVRNDLPPRTNLSPKEDGIEEDQGRTPTTRELSSSSSLRRMEEGTPKATPTPAATVTTDSSATSAAIALVQATFEGERPAIANAIREKIARGCDPAWIAGAVAVAVKGQKPFGYFLGILENYAEQGGPVGGMKSPEDRRRDAPPEVKIADIRRLMAAAKAERHVELRLKEDGRIGLFSSPGWRFTRTSDTSDVPCELASYAKNERSLVVQVLAPSKSAPEA